MPIIALTLQDSPEAFHRAVVNAAANTGHTLCHPGIQQFLVEGSAGVLESTVAVEQRVCIRIFQNSFIKRVKNQLVVISVTNNIADDSPVTQIENRTQIELVDNWTCIPLELRFNTCDSVTKMLVKVGMRSEWTLSGKEAVLRARQSIEMSDAYHAYIIDWRLPDRNGIEVTRQIRSLNDDGDLVQELRKIL